MILDKNLVNWLLAGDVALQFQVHRDLLAEERPDLQKRITTEGWGKDLLLARSPHGHWGLSFYQPKWTSSHYTLLDLRNLCIRPDIPSVAETLEQIVHDCKGTDGGINPSGTINKSDVCINGMFLNYACYFGMNENHIGSVVDFVLSQILPDGGFNCRFNRSGASHSSVHSTLSVVEGLAEYRMQGYTYRIQDILRAEKSGREFLLMHRLFRSDRTGEIIHPSFLRMPYPSRWKYDVLRALDYFRHSGAAWDDRLEESMQWLTAKRSKDGTWKLNAPYPGKTHFGMEKPGQPSRWNTLRAMRVLNYFTE